MGSRPPCYFTKPDGKTFCDKGRPFRDLYTINLKAYRHYREARATGIFPDDDIVRKNAAIFHAIDP